MPWATLDNGEEDATEKEWLFDFLLSVFRSPQWDAAVMGFIDEHCAVFDTDEENKLSYTAMHQQFKDLVSRSLLLHVQRTNSSITLTSKVVCPKPAIVRLGSTFWSCCSLGCCV